MKLVVYYKMVFIGNFYLIFILYNIDNLFIID